MPEPPNEAEPAAVVRLLVERFNALPSDPEARRGSPEVRELLGMFDEEVSFRSREQLDAPGGTGRSQFSAGWEEWLSLWKSQRSEIVNLESHGDRVLLHTRERFVGRDGVEVEWDASSVYVVAGGKVVSMDVHGTDHDGARAAFEQGPGAGSD